MRRLTLALIAALLVVTWAAGCGQRGSRYGSTSGAPVTGVSPWFKVDFDPDVDFTQPYVLYGDAAEALNEPAYLIVGETHHLFYEITTLNEAGDQALGRRIAYARSRDGVAWEVQNDGAAVLQADEPWEGGGVGAPSALWIDGRFRLWYAAGEGAGIGYAESDDGIAWEKHADNPVLVADQQWEGGAGGVVASPTVDRRDGRYHMYYSGGVLEGPPLAQAVGWAIGYARSDDGLTWIKRDAAGGDPDAGAVQPVLTPTQAWEGVDDEGNGGAVCCPFLRVDHPLDRDVYRLYYTGNQLGDPVLHDVGVGYAGGFDGLHWKKLDEPFDPVLNEHFPLTIYGASQYITYSESAPAVVRLGQTYRMMFAQIDLFGTLQGLAIAVHPKPDSL